jgi:DNA-binding transcriptional LysR family regulator
MDIDSNCFRTFKATCQTLNFTEASRQLGMTQSGVSQHVARLEKDVGAELFLRIGKRVVLTESGRALLKFIETYQDQVTGLRDSIRDITTSIQGRVSYGMPETCLLSPHFNLLLEVRKRQFPELELSVELLASEEVLDRILAASLDFGFVTKKLLSDELDYQLFCDEEYVLVSNRENGLRFVPEDCEWIRYPGSDVLTEIWLSHQDMKLKKSLSMKESGKTNSLHAAFIMVSQGLGFMVVPRHCVDASGLSSMLQVHELGKRSVRNTIYIATLKSRVLPMRVKVVIEAFHSLKGK